MAQAHGTRRRARRPARELSQRVQDDDARDEREEEEPQDEGGGGGQQDGGAISQLRGVMSEAAVSVLSPVAKKLATQAAKSAVERGPELLENVMPKLQELGGRFGGSDEDDEEGGGGGGAGDGTGKGRRMPIQQAVDVAAPLEVVYDQFTQFEDYPKFMHRVERVEQRDDERVVFHEKIWGVRRTWEAEIVEQIPDERIVWRTVSGMSHVGVVTFHELSDRLTRIELNLDLEPDGPIEKLARGARFAKRAARADLKRFKAFVEMHGEETGGWRGEIEDGEVVEEDDYEDEPEAYEEDEPQAEAEDDDRASRRAAGKSGGNGGKAKAKPKAKASSSSSRGRGSGSSGSSRSRSGSSRSGSSGGGSSSRSKASSGKRSR